MTSGNRQTIFVKVDGLLKRTLYVPARQRHVHSYRKGCCTTIVHVKDCRSGYGDIVFVAGYAACERLTPINARVPG